MPPHWQDRRNQQHQCAPEPASGATWETICHQLTATEKRSERSKAGERQLTHADHHGRGRGIWWGGSSSQGSRPSQGGAVFSVSLDLDTKAGLGETLMQNDHMHSENKVFLHTRFSIIELWFESDLKKREYTWICSLAVGWSFEKGKHGTDSSILEPQKWRGSGFGVATIKRAFEGKTHLRTPEDVHSWTTWFSYSVKLWIKIFWIRGLVLGFGLNGVLFDHIIYFCDCRGSQYHFLSHNAASLTSLEIQGLRKKDKYIHVHNICTSIW